MRVTKEMFDSLNQLDRIEFRQRYNEIDDISCITNRAIIFSFGILAFLFIFDTWNALHTGNWFNISMYVLLAKCCILYVFISLGIDIINVLIFFRNKNRLIKEYFSVEVKRRKK